MSRLWVVLAVLAVTSSGCASWHYVRTKPGELHGKLIVRWIDYDQFIFLPDKDKPLTFTRFNRDPISPGRMYTDGGSIPRPLWVFRSSSPWGYAPAFIVHDWLFHMRHCQLPGYEKSDVNEAAWVMSEVMKTMMEQEGQGPPDELTLYAMFEAVRSPIAAKLWNQSKEETCKEPPEEPGGPPSSLAPGHAVLRRPITQYTIEFP